MYEITSPSRRYSVDLPQGGLEILKFDGDEKDVAKTETYRVCKA